MRTKRPQNREHRRFLFPLLYSLLPAFLPAFSNLACARLPSSSNVTPNASSTNPHQRFALIPRLFMYTSGLLRVPRPNAARIVPISVNIIPIGNARIVKHRCPSSLR